TVSAYGPISAYLSERVPTEIRSTGYGAGYSLSLVLPALYPLYVPARPPWLGQHGTVLALVRLVGALGLGGAALGPRLSGRELDADLDAVAMGAGRCPPGALPRRRTGTWPAPPPSWPRSARASRSCTASPRRCRWRSSPTGCSRPGRGR